MLLYLKLWRRIRKPSRDQTCLIHTRARDQGDGASLAPTPIHSSHGLECPPWATHCGVKGTLRPGPPLNTALPGDRRADCLQGGD